MTTRRNNKNAGNTYERLVANELRELGYKVFTARAESRNMDNKGIDLFGPDLPFHVQCKITKDRPNYHNLITSPLLEEEKKPLLIFHRLVAKSNVRFVAQGDYVIMTKSAFYEMLEGLKK
jgi:hypothetical protein